MRSFTEPGPVSSLAPASMVQPAKTKRFWPATIGAPMGAGILCFGLCARAAIVGPYSPDADTLHLWHLDESAVPALDSAPGGTNLTALGGSASLGNASHASFGTALNTGTTSGDYLAPRPLVSGTGDDTLMTYADPATGAFTFEAMVRVDFEPATFNPGNNPLCLITGENETGARPWQFRIHTNGVAGSGIWQLQFFNLLAVGNTPFTAEIPGTGPDALAQGNWYHVAVTFDGGGAGGSLNFYWTLLDPTRVQANWIGGGIMPDLVPLASGAIDFSVGNVGRNTPGASFVGLMDEVRLSKVARASTQMLFNGINVLILKQPVSQTVAVGQLVSLNALAAGAPPLSYQWRFDSAPISGATQSVHGITAAQLTNSGDYDVVVLNEFSAATSAVARITVLPWGPVALRIARAGADFLLAWPLSATPFALQSATRLTAATLWETVTNPVLIGPTQNTVTVPNLGAERHFRLRGPADANAVLPIDWSVFTAGSPSDANAQRSAAILRNACKYAMTTWWTNYYAVQDATNYLDFGGTGETQIRRPAMEAYGLAVALQTGVYDPAYTGVTLADARSRTLKLIRSLGYRHRASQLNGWGNHWQSALWTGLAGTAGWMLWTNLSDLDQESVRRMVEYEANRFTHYAVPYYKDRAGTIVYPGDTKCEENAWNASVLHLALCMMPAHANTSLWWNKAIELTLSTYARPSDLERTNVYHGRSLASWLNGSNANEDATVINHNLVHPDYMAAGLCYNQPAWVYLLADMPVPLASFFNLDHVYRAMVDLNFVVGAIPYPTGLTNRPPGGFLYVRDAYNQPTTNLYYPNGDDWGSSRRMQFAALDATVRAFGLDHLASIPSDLWEAQHSQVVLEMQARFNDGRTYGATSEDKYDLREEWLCDYAARCYLTKWLVHQDRVRISNEPTAQR